MYDFIRGQLVGKSPTSVVVDVNGVGYVMHIPLSTFGTLPEEGEVRLLAWFHVTEKEHRLFGFTTEEERELFVELVRNVKNIGPSVALGVLSSCGVEEFYQAVLDGDDGRLRQIKGVGPKAASRLVVEMKEMAESRAPGAGTNRKVDTQRVTDTVNALVSLGYQRSEARKTVDKVVSGADAGLGVEDWVRMSLQALKG